MIKPKIAHIAIAVLITAIFFQCKPDSEEIKYPAVHYDVGKIIDEQVSLLDSLSPKLVKTLKFNSGESETTETEVNWKEELALFRQMNINKPALAPQFDSVVNEAIIYRPKEEDNKVNVKELKVKLAENNYPEKIGATIIEDNYLYASEKKLMMQFDPEKKRLTSFEIRSRTKVILMGEDKGEIHAKLIY